KPHPKRKSCSSVTSLSTTANSPSPLPNPSPPGEKPTPPRSKEPYALNKNAPWLRITPSPLKARSFKSPNLLPIAPTPTRGSMCMCCWTARWSFSTKTKKSLASTPKQRTQLAYIARSASGKGSAMDLFRLYRLKHSNCHPDIFTLLLPSQIDVATTFLFCLMKNPLLYRSARPQSGREASERFLMETLGRTQSERRRRLALAGGFRFLRLFRIDRLDAAAHAAGRGSVGPDD